MQNIREAKLLAQRLLEYRKAGKRSSLLTVVRVIGSAFRREGAKFLVSEEGEEVCSISGGCLEQGLKEEAIKVIKTGKPLLERVDMQDSATWGMWLGCPGEVEIYIEPFEYDDINNKWIELMLEGERFALLKRLFSKDKLLVTERERFIHGELERYYPHAEGFLSDRDSTPYLEGDIFFDKTLHYPPLLLVGTGEEIYRISEIASNVGFEPRIFSPAQRFSIPEGAFVVIASHHLKADRQLLRRALESGAVYIGVISSFRRFLRFSEGLDIDDRVFCPAGLDTGNLTPEEIALSVVAEIMKVYRGRSGKSLREVKAKEVVRNGT